jgi:hypothetical protein
MAVITQTTVTGVNAPVTIASTTLGASDTLVYTSGGHQLLILENTTGGSLTATITGSTAGTISPSGLGGTVSVASGFAITVAAGASKVIALDKISAYLSGTITVTGAATMTAKLLK